ncbi:MAG: hypothetical protein Fues2KO_48760 [Fuerstiella sp.]
MYFWPGGSAAKAKSGSNNSTLANKTVLRKNGQMEQQMDPWKDECIDRPAKSVNSDRRNGG